MPLIVILHFDVDSLLGADIGTCVKTIYNPLESRIKDTVEGLPAAFKSSLVIAIGEVQSHNRSSETAAVAYGLKGIGDKQRKFFPVPTCISVTL